MILKKQNNYFYMWGIAHIILNNSVTLCECFRKLLNSYGKRKLSIPLSSYILDLSIEIGGVVPFKNHPKTKPQINKLLSSLKPDEWEMIFPHLEFVDLPAGTILGKAEVPFNYAYFPTSCIVNLLYVLESGASTSLAEVGCEGMVGMPLFMGGGSTTTAAVVIRSGEGYRLKAKFFQENFTQSISLVHLLLRYAQALLTQLTQMAVCNRYHPMDQQICRLLLQSLDRQHDNVLLLTQELISTMLGVRREGITDCAIKLQKDGVISYVRGQITVHKRHELEKRSCECYMVVKKEFDRLLPAPSH